MKNYKIIKDIQAVSSNETADSLKKFFQTKKGCYAENDLFYGVKVPVLRKIAKNYIDTDYNTLQNLINNPYHEVRECVIFILLLRFKKYENEKEQILNFYLDNTKYINNWDLVDLSAGYILGNYEFSKSHLHSKLLNNLSNSDNLWEKRIAIVATHYFIKHGKFDLTLKFASKFINEKHHLLHKASGWMLREIGKKDLNTLYNFLDNYAKNMPRVMLRYAIEKLEPDKKKYYMNM